MLAFWGVGVEVGGVLAVCKELQESKTHTGVASEECHYCPSRCEIMHKLAPVWGELKSVTIQL